MLRCTFVTARTAVVAADDVLRWIRCEQDIALRAQDIGITKGLHAQPQALVIAGRRRSARMKRAPHELTGLRNNAVSNGAVRHSPASDRHASNARDAEPA